VDKPIVLVATDKQGPPRTTDVDLRRHDRHLAAAAGQQMSPHGI
jgi:hypothetical protein